MGNDINFKQKWKETKSCLKDIWNETKQTFGELKKNLKIQRKEIKREEFLYNWKVPSNYAYPQNNSIPQFSNQNLYHKMNNQFSSNYNAQSNKIINHNHNHNHNLNNNNNNFTHNKNFYNNLNDNNFNYNNNMNNIVQNNNNNSINQINLNNNNQSDHLRGLVNIANTCYMNSTIQCFAHITELFQYFRKPKIMELTRSVNRDQKLFPVFSELINSLWIPNDSSPLYPYIFKQRLGEMNPLFVGAIPNDAKDLLTFILMQLHEELNKPKNDNNLIKNINPNIEMQKNQKLMLQYFVKYFMGSYRSIISELFYGLNYNVTQCSLCGITLYNYQTFNFLIFPLFEVLNNKMKLVNNQNNFNYTVTLDDCFQFNQIYTPLNGYYCNVCNHNTQGQYASFLSVLPNIIIIILNRGVGLQYKVKIDFDENLNLKNYVEYFKENSFYELIGVVTHYGESGISGHFIARCKSPLDNNWYLYNDAIINKIGYFDKGNFLQGNPYILFYKRTQFQNK